MTTIVNTYEMFKIHLVLIVFSNFEVFLVFEGRFWTPGPKASDSSHFNLHPHKCSSTSDGYDPIRDLFLEIVVSWKFR